MILLPKLSFFFCVLVELSTSLTAKANTQPSFHPTCQNWSEPCPLDAPFQNCMIDPCSIPNICPEESGLICRSNHCGSCRAICCLDTDSNSYVPTMRDITRSLTSKTQNDDEIICAGDLILCWDGTIVSRDPENHCHLSACPEFSWSGVLRTPLVSLLAFVQRLVLAFLDFLPRCGVLCDVYFSFLALGETK